ncbi:hypothetical protein Tco_0148941 [Tanacetum coccineum]
MGKTIAELHAMLKLHANGIPNKAETPTVLTIVRGIKKDKEKPQGVKGKDKRKTKLAYSPKVKIIFRQRTLSATTIKSLGYMIRAVEFISVIRQGLRENKKLKHKALSLCVGNGMLATIKAIGSFDFVLPRYLKEMMGYYFYYSLENKIFVAQNAEFFENGLTIQEASRSHGLLKVSGRDVGLELIQEDDRQPYENTSDRHIKVKSNKVEPHSVEVLIRRPGRISQAPDIYGFYVDDEEHELGDHNETPNYEATLSYPESNKWLDAMNTEMQFMKDNQQNPGEAHWTAVKTILKYLRNTKDMVLVYGANPETKLKLTCYIDAEAEYIAATEASMKAVWMRKFIDGLGNVMPTNKRHMEMLCDNMPAIAIANDPEIMKGSRHYQRKYHYIRKVIQDVKLS